MKRVQNKSNIEIVKNYINLERLFVQVGYEPPTEIKHKVNDVWTDKDGKEWIQTLSGKISKNLYNIQNSTKQICPFCKKDIYWGGTNYDEKFFNKTGKCYDCVIEEEHKMRLDGTFQTYEKIKVIKNQQSYLKELQVKIQESITYLINKNNKVEYINEDGTLESWTDTSRETVLEDAKKDLVEVKKSLILCEESIKMLEEEFNSKKPVVVE